jgi:Lactonase, 7-bladed beta-propeller
MAGCAIVQDRGSIPVLAGFTIDRNGALSPIANSPFPVGNSGVPDPPLSVTVHPSGRFVYSSEPFGSSIWVFNLDPAGGTLAPVAGSPFIIGFPNISNQPGAVALDPSGQFAYVITNWERPAGSIRPAAFGGSRSMPGSDHSGRLRLRPLERGTLPRTRSSIRRENSFTSPIAKMVLSLRTRSTPAAR